MDWPSEAHKAKAHKYLDKVVLAPTLKTCGCVRFVAPGANGHGFWATAYTADGHSFKKYIRYGALN